MKDADQEQVLEKRTHVSQEQDEQPQQEVVEKTETIPAKKQDVASKPIKVTKESEKALSPRPSYWPLALAFSLSLLLLGIVLNSIIVFCIGVVFIIVSVIGWGLERR